MGAFQIIGCAGYTLHPYGIMLDSFKLKAIWSWFSCQLRVN